MAICRSCSQYYKMSKWNPTDQCEECSFSEPIDMLDEEDSVEVEHLLNPTGATKPVFYD